MVNLTTNPLAIGVTDKIDSLHSVPVSTQGGGMYLHWDGRRSYRTRMPAPRVLEPVIKYGVGSNAENMLIEGDNLQAMVSLRSQWRGRVDIAYLDPPYNTGRGDFRYSDRRFHDPNADSKDGVYINSEDGGRHTKWLNYMGPRLHLTWELLAQHGVCFISIDDNELFRAGLLMDEIFGEKNRLGVLVWHGAIENNPTHIAQEHEYILCYAKRVESVPRAWKGESAAKQWLLDTFAAVELEAGKDATAAQLQRTFQAAIRDHEAAFRAEIEAEGETELVELGRARRYKFVDERGVYAAEDHTDKPSGGYHYDVLHPVTGKPCKRPASGYRFKEDTMKRLLEDGRVVFRRDHTLQLQVKKYLSEVAEPLRSVIEIPAKLGTATLKNLIGKDDRSKFLHPKPVELIELLINSVGYEDPVVLDPFAGSGTTGHAVMRLNARDGRGRRFIMIEEGTPEDPYCRTLTAPRLKAAIHAEKLSEEFQFLAAGRRLDRDAILELEREAIANLIIQTDATGAGSGISRVKGTHVIGHNSRREAICLYWNGRDNATVSRSILSAMYREAKDLGFNRPLRVYGAVCTVGETESFRFLQIPDEILIALQLTDLPDALDSDADELEVEQTAVAL